MNSRPDNKWRISSPSLLIAICYACIVTITGCGGGGGSDTSPTNEASAPSITSQPLSQTVTIGQSATLTASASGTAPLTYQWQKDGENIVGETSNILTITATGAAESGDYSVTVTNSIGSANSSTATISINPGRFIVRAWQQDGSKMNTADYSEMEYFSRADKWIQQGNMGFFEMGTLPITQSLGSTHYTSTIGGEEEITFTVNTGQDYYYTVLWYADDIGSVFMRADNQGLGYSHADSDEIIIEIPHAFAVSELATAERLLSQIIAPSFEAQTLLQQATNAMETANSAGDSSARAVESYVALSYIMRLKEQLAIDESNQSITATGARVDFDFNYEGFSSWTDVAHLPGYDAALDAGFTSVLTNVEWRDISPSQGEYDFSGLDYAIDRAEELGFTIALNINRNYATFPNWMKSLSLEDLKQRLYDNAYAVVSRYGSRVRWYYPTSEFELETNGRTLEELADMAKSSLDGARAADSSRDYGIYVSASAYVTYQMNPGPNPNYFTSYDFLTYLQDNAINYDFIGLQMQYGTTFASVDLHRFKEILQYVYNSFQLPIYMGETGFSSMAEDYGLPHSPSWHDGLDQNTQAEWADGTLRMTYSLPFVKGFYWVHLDPDDNDRDSDYLASLLGTGIVTSAGVNKQSQQTFKDFINFTHSLTPGTYGDSYSIVITEGDGQTVNVNSEVTENLVVLVRDFWNNPVPNANVTFTAPSTGASGLFEGDISSITVNTNSDGLVDAGLFTANNTAGDYLITVQVDESSISTAFELSNQ